MTLDNRDLRRGLEAQVEERTADVRLHARRSRLLLDSASEGVVELDRFGRVAFANPAAERMIGAQVRDLVGEPVEQVFAPRADGSRRPVPSPLRMGEALVGLPDEFAARGGRVFPVEYSASPIQDEQGAVAGAVVTFHDVSERREVERMKDEFVSVVSHELRTPMTSIRGSLGLIAGGAVGELPPQAQDMVRIALENSDRLTRLIDDILEIERIGSGTVPLQRRACAAVDLVGAAVRSVQGMAHGAGVRLAAPRAQGRVDADDDRVVQVLTNLIGNAVNFSPDGGQVRISAGPLESDPRQVLFCVSDDGPGIAIQDQGRIFDRFQKIDSPASRGLGGTGLGLAICKSLIDAHGGRIWVQSPNSDRERADGAGPGTTFCFTLPAADTGAATGRLLMSAVGEIEGAPR